MPMNRCMPTISANQETIVELVSFVQRSIPEELFSRDDDAPSVTLSSSQEKQEANMSEDERVHVSECYILCVYN